MFQFSDINLRPFGKKETAKQSQHGESTNRTKVRPADASNSAKLAMKAHSASKVRADKLPPLGINSREVISFQEQVLILDNDPSAGSPTETLLRLLLPLNAQVWSTSRQQGRIIRSANSPWTSLKRSIGSSDGRCVQRAGT